MAYSNQAKKRIRQNLKRRERNKARTSAMKSQLKKTEEVLASGNVEAARTALAEAMQKIDKAAKGHVIHKNTAARRKSLLSRRLLALERGAKKS